MNNDIGTIHASSTDLQPDSVFKNGGYFPLVTAKLSLLHDKGLRVISIFFSNETVCFPKKNWAREKAEKDCAMAFLKYHRLSAHERGENMLKELVEKGYGLLAQDKSTVNVSEKITVQ